MSSVRNHPVPAIMSASVFLSLLLISLPLATHAPANQAESPAAALGKTRSIAESQHEIVMILIRKKEFSRAIAEAGKIFDMKWPDDKEPLLLKELLYLADQLLRAGQPSAGVQFLETNLKSFKTAGSRAAVWKEKGYLYKNMKADDKALECFREAQRIEMGERR